MDTEQHDNELRHWKEKAERLAQEGRYEEALEAFEGAIRLAPTAADAWNDKGNALYSLGRYEVALRAYEEAIRLAPNCDAPWNGKGNALYDVGRCKDALAAYEEAIQLAPHNHAPWNGKGNALYSLGRYEVALRAYEEAIRLAPTTKDPWDGKGSAIYGLGRHEDALRAYEEAIRLEPRSGLSWFNKARLLRVHADLIKDRIDTDPRRCLCRAVFLAWPSCSAKDSVVLRSAVLIMAEDGAMGLLLERLVQKILPDGGLLTMEGVLRRAREDTEIARAVFAWLKDPVCPLKAVERVRLRGQVLLRFGDPIMARRVLDELDDTVEGERDLGGQLYLVWSLREYLEPHDEELDFAYTQAKKWMQGEWGRTDEMTYYYAGHTALAKADLAMARSAFDLAGREPAALLMGWHAAHLARDPQVAAERLDSLLKVERECLRAGRKGVLFPDVLQPFDPDTSESQDELQLVFRRFEVSGALMDLLETMDLREHPGYQALAGDFEERTRVFDDIERYEHAVRTWKVREEVRQELDRRQTAEIRQAAEKEMYTRARDFAILDVAPPCSLRGDALVERLAQGLFQRDLAGKGDAAMKVILSMLEQGRLKSEQAVLLTMYAYTKAHHDTGTARTIRVEKFAARTAMEAVIFYFLRRWGVAYAVSMFIGVSGWSLSKKLADAVQAACGNFEFGGSEAFPTYVEFVEDLHRYWEESGDAEEFRMFFQ